MAVPSLVAFWDARPTEAVELDALEQLRQEATTGTIALPEDYVSEDWRRWAGKYRDRRKD